MRRVVFVFLPIATAIVIACVGTDPDVDTSSSSSSGNASNSSASSGSSSASSGGASSGITSSGTSVGTTTSTSSGSTVPPGSKKVFITSGSYKADLGGVLGADAKCAAAADAAKLEGNFKAWLSVANNSPSTRFQKSTTPYVRLDNQIVAKSWPDLIDGTLDNPIEVDETGNLLVAVTPFVWTGTTKDGTHFFGANCDDWSNQEGSIEVHGIPTSKSDQWTSEMSPKLCASPGHLYCFEQ